MTVTYPLSVPSGLKVKNSSFRLARSVSISESPFTFAQQVIRNQGERWEGEVTLVPMKRSTVAEVQAFLAKLRGQYGTFLYGDPDYLALGPRGSGGGTPLVKGAGQTGNSLLVDGLPSATANVWRAGDYIQIGTGSSSRLHMIVTDMNTNTAGEGTAEIEPALRSSPSDNAVITHTGAKGVFRLSTNDIEWNADYANIYQITIAFKEAVSD